MGTSEQAVVQREPRRRRRSAAEKRRIVEETLEPAASVARVARAHGVNANQVFAWRRLYRQGLLCGEEAGSARLLPVAISDAPAREGSHEDARHGRCGAMDIELRQGQVRIRGPVDGESLRIVLECLRG